MTLFFALIAGLSAQTVPAPSFNKLPVERMCSAQGALGHSFGETGVPGAGSGIGADRTDLAPEFQPFTDVQLVETKWSHRFAGATYELYFEVPAAAKQAEAALIARLGAAGWTGYNGQKAARGLVLYSDESARNAEGGAIAIVSIGGKYLKFECTSMTLSPAILDEAVGKLPDDLAKPMPPVLALPAEIDPQSCTTESGRAAAEALLKGKPETFTRYVVAHADYRDRLTQWKLDRLRKTGKYSPEQLLVFAMAGLKAGQPDGDPAGGVRDSFAPFMAMMGDAEKLEPVLKSGDKEAICRGTLQMMRHLKDIDAVVLPQWLAMQAAIDAEAKRAGISLE